MTGAAVGTVIFDAGLTLLRVEPSWLHVVVQAASDAGAEVTVDDLVQRGEFRGIFREHDDAWRAAGESSPHIGDDDAERRFWEGLYLRFLSHLEVDGDQRAIAAAVYDAFLAPGTFRPYPEVVDVLGDLRERGIRLGLLSNWGPWLRDVLVHEGLDSWFEAIVISGEEGVEKPDPRIFHVALDRLGLQPGPHVAYVGDDLVADIAPTRALGMVPVLVDRGERYPGIDVARVTDLRQLPDVVPLRARDHGAA